MNRWSKLFEKFFLIGDFHETICKEIETFGGRLCDFKKTMVMNIKHLPNNHP
jgi:hypothetical protein